ncbi:MAG: DUF2723 domain-containing protein [Flavobacteriales bacterium]|nr:DUF2723 domain-containing protein [Flavobacteriales bacterium]MCB9449336.1 DUF2723 domain-containing protein [Flavobacteriales bacterium]
MSYARLNNIIGWVVFAIASTVFISTIEPTASFWDCGEYIATSYKLEVGHPPGAPLFMMLGRLFSLLASDTAHVAAMINTMSALCSGLTILFLFWSITMLGRKIIERKGEELTNGNTWAIMGAGIVGALAYTFTDSFWFSAVEGEVYAMSSFFTALVFWAILKWERVADESQADRWIVLIFYLMGLSIGVHLLNLLALPAMTFVYYFKKYEPSRKGLIYTSLISIVLLGGIQNVMIPGIVKLASKFELFFVNTINLPFNSGIIIYGLALTAGIFFGIRYTIREKKPLWNTVLLSFMSVLIGYSSFIMIVVRSNANPPMDENNPENMISLLAYLNREQYGDWPLAYGPYYDAKVTSYDDGNPVYVQDKETGKYVVSDDRKGTIPVYDPERCTVFPRMHSVQPSHIRAYKKWGGITGDRKPNFGDNLTFFVKYQIGHMYLRYFLWNFAGRQNDVQGHGGITNGNWISGIKPLDAMFLGNQSELPDLALHDKSRNTFYLLPLILGIIGLIFHFKQHKEDALTVTLLFLFTGFAIIIYLNQTPFQPRERDYAYAASFYAFAIWIGLGVMAIHDKLKNLMSPSVAAVLTTTVCTLAVPVVMGKEGYDDHDRSGTYTARDFAANYLNSCAKNAILFTNGDNDTFPLWYAQEVEGIRTDVRVVNLSLLNTDWYIDQMRRKAYDSDPVPFSLKPKEYIQGTRDYVPFYDQKLPGFVEARKLMDFVKSDNPQTKLGAQGGKMLDYLPTNRVLIPVDKQKVISNGTVPPELADQVVNGIEWTINEPGGKPKRYLLKNHLMVLDLLAHNNWERPVYFAVTVGNDNYLGLEDYFQLEGLAYHLVPIKNNQRGPQVGRVEANIMYDNMMNKFAWGGMDSGKDIYLNDQNRRMVMNFRNNFARLAIALIQQGKNDEAEKALDHAVEVMPNSLAPYNYFITPIAEAYYQLGKADKANAILNVLLDNTLDEMDYFASLKRDDIQSVSNDISTDINVLRGIDYQAQTYKQDSLSARVRQAVARYEQAFNGKQPVPDNAAYDDQEE